MAMRKVPLYQKPLTFTTVEEGATKGATVGLNLFWPDGSRVTEDQLTRAVSTNDTEVLGLLSLQVVPTASGQFAVQLVGDAEGPGNFYYYGTNGSGTKGWHGPIMLNPMTTEGDLIVGDVGGVPVRLPIGGEGQVLTIVGGVPAYAAAPSGGVPGGIGISIGTYSSTASVIAALTEATSLVGKDYELTGEWNLWCYPSATLAIDVWSDTFGNVPTVADSICGGSPPSITAGTFNSGSFTGPITVDRMDTLLAHLDSNDNAKWVYLLLIGA